MNSSNSDEVTGQSVAPLDVDVCVADPEPTANTFSPGIELASGQRVRLVKLKNSPELNGKLGRVVDGEGGHHALGKIHVLRTTHTHNHRLVAP